MSEVEAPRSETRILIVDDEKNIRKTVAYALEGYDVATAVNGEDALQQLQTQPADIVLLDLRMPGMDGLELLRHLATDYPQIRVIILTAHGTVENAIEAMKLGAIDFLQKPFSPQEIRTAVQELLQRQSVPLPIATPAVPPAPPQEYDTNLLHIKNLLNQRQWPEAEQLCHHTIGLNPLRPHAYNLLGTLYDIRYDHHTAMKFYRVALDLDGTYEPARYNLGRTDPARILPKLG
jgi:DNA-binding response OmpR family regulator